MKQLMFKDIDTILFVFFFERQIDKGNWTLKALAYIRNLDMKWC